MDYTKGNNTKGIILILDKPRRMCYNKDVIVLIIINPYMSLPFTVIPNKTVEGFFLLFLKENNKKSPHSLEDNNIRK